MAGYGTDGEFSTWLTDNGLTLPVGAPALAVLRNRGSDYVDATYGHRLRCSIPTGGADQERAFPRTGHLFIPNDAIPRAWINASYRAAYLSATLGGGLSRQIDPNARVTKQKVDTIERTFADNGAPLPGQAVGLVDAEIDGLVSPYLCRTEYEIGIQVV